MNITLHTPFSRVYDSFLSKITDDMYMELTELDTYRILEELLVTAIHKFEFPRVDLTVYETELFADQDEYTGVESDGETAIAYIYDEGFFAALLTEEEINILSTYMIVEWFGYQLASVENTRMKYSGTDFKFTSQANHMQKLLALKKDYEREGFHLQRLYKRRKADANGIMRSAFGQIIEPVSTSTSSSTSTKSASTSAEIAKVAANCLSNTVKTIDYVDNALTWGDLEEDTTDGD